MSALRRQQTCSRVEDPHGIATCIFFFRFPFCIRADTTNETVIETKENAGDVSSVAIKETNLTEGKGKMRKRRDRPA